jgi:hypothetical protein
MQDHPHTGQKPNLGNHLDLPWNWEFSRPISDVLNVSIVRYVVRQMQWKITLGYMGRNREVIVSTLSSFYFQLMSCLLLCPFVMKCSKFKLYSGDCRAPHDEVQAHLKHMLYQECGNLNIVCSLWAIFLYFECLSCILLAWNSSVDSKATMCTYGHAIL